LKKYKQEPGRLGYRFPAGRWRVCAPATHRSMQRV